MQEKFHCLVLLLVRGLEQLDEQWMSLEVASVKLNEFAGVREREGWYNFRAKVQSQLCE